MLRPRQLKLLNTKKTLQWRKQDETVKRFFTELLKQLKLLKVFQKVHFTSSYENDVNS